MLRAALSYSTRKPNGPRSVLVGGGIVFVVNLFGLSSVLDSPLTYAGLLGVLPWVVLRGYYVRVVKTTIGRDRPTPPPFDDIGRLFRNGLASLLISACYLLPAAVVLAPLAYARALGRDPAALFAAAGLPTVLANAALSVTGVVALFAVMYLLGALYALVTAVCLDGVGALSLAADRTGEPNVGIRLRAEVNASRVSASTRASPTETSTETTAIEARTGNGDRKSVV